MILDDVLTGLAYPLAMTGIAPAIFRYQADGSLIPHDGKVIGSSSATTNTDPNERGLPEAKVRQRVQDHIAGRIAGLIGEPHVHVLQLNMALDALGHS
jgi:K+-transporting ATPase c subunit